MARLTRREVFEVERALRRADSALAARKAKTSRLGRPSLDDLDIGLIKAVLGVAETSKVPLMKLLRANVRLGALPGNSKRSTAERVRRKTRMLVRPE